MWSVNSINLRSLGKWALLALPFLILWFCLINNLRVEWETNPQYSFGFVVPFLCLSLLFGRWHSLPQAGALPVPRFPLSTLISVLPVLLVVLALLYLPTRVIQAATPEWRPVEWAFGITVIGLTLGGLYFALGPEKARHLAFPILFFLVAIPWPTPIEEPIIQGLTRFNAGAVVEVMGVFGIPALQHGNVIEVGTGVVGIDEACSGIRSFQSALMLSLFLGELYRLIRWRRLLLVPLSFALAIGFNVVRTSLLTWVAARKGTAAITQYHDPAGFTIMIACTLAVMGAALWLKKSQRSPRDMSGSASSPDSPVPASGSQRPAFSFQFPAPGSSIICFSASLLVWVAVVEFSVLAWYHVREAHFVASPKWSLNFPVDKPSFKSVDVAEAARQLLRYDDGKQGEWQDDDGSRWEAFYFDWFPGRVAGYLAKRHTPEACLPGAGCQLLTGPELMVVKVGGIELPVRHYEFSSAAGTLQVFHCRWEDGMTSDNYVLHETTRFNLLRGVWAGRGNHGQKVLEFIVSGIADPEEAKQALVRHLNKLIMIQQPTAAVAANSGVAPASP